MNNYLIISLVVLGAFLIYCLISCKYYCIKCINFRIIQKYKFYQTRNLKDFLKIAALILLHRVARIHDRFNNNPILKIIIYTTISLGIILLYSYFTTRISSTEPISHESIGNGFFIAPLVTLMITQQERFIKMFLTVFELEDKNRIQKEDDDIIELDEESNEIKVRLLNIRNNESQFTDGEKNIWRIIEETWIYAANNRKNFKRKNTQALIMVASILMVGYIFYILTLHNVALFFLIFSLLILLNRLFLGIRTMLKFHLIAKVSKLLSRTMNNVMENEFKNIVPR